jgi:phage terminase large subunit-like protein
MARWERDRLPCVAVAQTMAGLTGACKELERLILSGKIRHDGHPVLRWCVGNVVADTDGNGNIKPSKKKSHERIDGVSALVTALTRAMATPIRAATSTSCRAIAVMAG